MMADEFSDADQTAGERRPRSGSRWKTLLCVAGLMLAEGVAVFAVMKLIQPEPDATLAAMAEGGAKQGSPFADQVEVVICEVDAYNGREGRLYLYHLQLSALIAAEDKERLEQFVAARQMTINDRVQTVIRAADPSQLNEPSLETLKRQLTFEINQLLGAEGLVQGILVSKLLQSPARL